MRLDSKSCRCPDSTTNYFYDSWFSLKLEGIPLSATILVILGVHELQYFQFREGVYRLRDVNDDRTFIIGLRWKEGDGDKERKRRQGPEKKWE